MAVLAVAAKGKRRARKARGITVPMTAAFVVTLFAMAALAVDFGVAYTARASVQHAADAAALAGAFTFVNQQNADDPAQAARDAAAAVANTSYVLGQQVGRSATPVDGGALVPAPCTTLPDNTVCVDSGNRRVVVKILVPVSTYFASIWPSFGLLNVRALATAEAAPHAAGTRCMKPIYMPNTAMNPPNGGHDGGGGGGGNNGVSDACSRNQVFFDPVTLRPTAWAQSKLGTSFTLSAVGSDRHDGEGEDHGNGPNQYLPLNFGNGTAGYSCGISHCLNDSACSGSIDPSLFPNSVAGCIGANNLKTLSSVDPSVTRSAFQDLQGGNPDRFFEVGSYGANIDNAADTSVSVITVPVWNNCDPRYPIANGVQTYPVAGMVQIFADPPDSNGNLTAHLVGFADCDANSNGTGPGAIPVRLVNTAAQ
jgi:Flp pilus assembly protein TadG